MKYNDLHDFVQQIETVKHSFEYVEKLQKMQALLEKEGLGISLIGYGNTQIGGSFSVLTHKDGERLRKALLEETKIIIEEKIQKIETINIAANSLEVK